MSDLACRTERFDSREAWLAARRSGVGSSDVAPILGESSWGTALSVWSEKVGLVERDQTETEWQAWGHILEPVIIGQLAKETGIPFAHQDLCIVRHAGHPELFCSPDALCEYGRLVTTIDEVTFAIDDSALCAAEVKNVTGFKASEWEDEIPRHVWMQVQHAMDCMGLSQMHVAALIGGNRFVWTIVDRDDEHLNRVRPLLIEFARQVREEDPPEPTADDGPTLAQMHAESDPEAIVSLPPEAWKWTDRIHAIEDSIKRRKRIIDALKNRIRAALGPAETGTMSDGRSWTWKTSKNGQRRLLGPGKTE